MTGSTGDGDEVHLDTQLSPHIERAVVGGGDGDGDGDGDWDSDVSYPAEDDAGESAPRCKSRGTEHGFASLPAGEMIGRADGGVSNIGGERERDLDLDRV